MLEFFFKCLIRWFAVYVTFLFRIRVTLDHKVFIRQRFMYDYSVVPQAYGKYLGDNKMDRKLANVEPLLNAQSHRHVIYGNFWNILKIFGNF